MRFLPLALASCFVCSGASLTVASLNLAMVTDVDRMVREISAVPALRDADVLFLQEVVQAGSTNAAEAIARRLGHHVLFASPDGKGTFSGIAIVSRHAMTHHHVYKLKQQNLVFRSRSRIALAATLQTPDGPVRVVNTHLDTRINPGERLAQLQPALDDAACFQGPTVIGGDFNTNDMQWVSNVVPVPYRGWQGARVRALMASRGFTTPFQTRRATFDHFGMQLDWIYTNGMNSLAAGIEPLEFSDHHAVWTRLVSPSQGSSPRTVRSQAVRRAGA